MIEILCENYICKGNSMVSRAIWKKTWTSDFFKDYQNCPSPKDECLFFQIARETIQLLINLIYMKKLYSHMHKSHLEIKKIKKFEN